MTIPEEAGKVATSAIDAFKAQPGLLFLTLVNIAFLIFTYMLGNLVLEAYNKQTEQMHARYVHTIAVVDRCINAALGDISERLQLPDVEPRDTRPERFGGD